jgi:FemAB-related protein (PEP-CTERM system-associated)
MNIRPANDSDRAAWDAFVQNHPDCSPYHLSAWTRAIERAYGFKSFNLIAEKDTQISGIFPLTMLKIPFKKPDLVALPYCDVGFPITLNSQVQGELLNEAVSIAKTNNASSIEIRGHIDYDLIQNQGYPFQVKSEKVRMLLELPPSAEDLWNGFPSKLRSQIRKAEKNGLRFQFSNESIDDFYAVMTTNMRDLGSPVHGAKWFKEIIRQFADKAKIGLVYHQETAIGAGLILRAGNKISIPWASTLRPFNRLNPNMLLYWKFLEYAADSGAEVFDFGRSTQNEGTYKFKSQWGAQPAALDWYTLFLNAPAPKNRQKTTNYREFAEKNWQRLPLFVANFLGPLLRKYIKL